MLGNIQTYAYNPAAIQRAIMGSLNAINQGTVQIVDGTNPFVFALETSCVNASAMMQQNQALTRRLYPAAATTVDDLYLHMADTDYVNIFALPTTANFNIWINQQQLLNSLVTDSYGNASVTIPRNSIFYAAGIPFSIQYPIHITQLQHGSLRILYDLVSNPSPLQSLPTNVIDYSTVNDPSGTAYIAFSVPTQQFDIVELVNDVNSTGGFTTAVPFTQNFYYARVYSMQSDGTWGELPVTYTQAVYDPAVPTAYINVANSTATVTIPLVYISTGMISGKVRIDVYETMGPMTQLLGNYQPGDFSADFRYLDSNDATAQVAAFNSLTGIAVYSTDTTTGGRAALTFSQLQNRVINSSIGPRNIPITPSQIQNTLLDLGYTLVKNVDTITNRVYWATKAMPIPNSPNLVTPANGSVVTVITNVAQADSLQGCISHSTGMTITSSALIQNSNGISSLVTSASYSSLMSQALAQLATSVNTGNYVYSPFYYVLDTTASSFNVRPYYMDTPTIVGRSFVLNNLATGLQVSIDPTYSIVKTSIGYRLTLTTQSSTSFQTLHDNEVFCQLCFTSPGQPQKAYMLGVQQAKSDAIGERTYVFDIETNYDIDINDQMLQRSFSTNVVGSVPRSSLSQEINVLFITNSSDILATSTTPINTAPHGDIDLLIGGFQLPAGVIGITNEKMLIEFGYSLKTLWNSYRSIIAPIPYQTYASNVPKTYATDVYEVDPVTGANFKVTNGQVVFTKLHSAGDPVLDSNGQPVYLYTAGSPIIDAATGLPVPIVNYNTKINRSLDIVAIDGVYQFANDPVTTAYVAQIDNSLITSLTEDLVSLMVDVLEKTEIYYYPAVTSGTVNVVADNNQIVNIPAAQELKVIIYVANEVYQNNLLTASLQSATIKTIGTFLANNSTVAISQLEEALGVIYGTDALGVGVSGLGGSANYSVVTVTDSSTMLSINKILVVQPNNQLAVQEDVSVVFELHTTSNI